jgi:hypothetical protein
MSGSHKSQYKSIYKKRILDKKTTKAQCLSYNKRRLHRELSKKTSGSLRHLNRSRVRRSRCTDEGAEAEGAEAEGNGIGRIRHTSLGA